MLFKILASLLLVIHPSEVLVDRIAAVVNNEIITISDIDKSLLFCSPVLAFDKDEEELYKNELQKMINYKVIYLEYKDQFQLSDEDFENIQRQTIERYGSIKELLTILEKMDMTISDFRNFIREKVFYDKVIRDKFKMGIVIDYREIEDFYNNEYHPLQQELNLEPKSIIEMTPVIEEHLRSGKVKKELSQWLNSIKSSYIIRNILEQDNEK